MQIGRLNLANSALPIGVSLFNEFGRRTEAIGRVTFSHDGLLLASSAADGSITLWDTDSGQERSLPDGHDKAVTSVCFSVDGTMIATGSRDATVKLWDRADERYLRALPHYGWVKSVEFFPDGRIATGSDDVVRIWNARTGAILHKLQKQHDWITSIAISRDGTRLASATSGGEVWLWDVGEGPTSVELIKKLEGHSSACNSVVFSPAGAMLASAGKDGRIWLWDAGTGDAIQGLEGHTGEVQRLAFSNDGFILASKSSDSTLRLWNVDNLNQEAVIVEMPSMPDSGGLAFHPHLSRLATVSTQAEDDRVDSRFVLFDLDTSTLFSHQREALSCVSAKIVIIGNTGVGKSCLSAVLKTGKYPPKDEHRITHGMRFYRLKPEDLLIEHVAPNERRDIVLWDLGGHPEYQLVHQLFLDDTTLALIVIDPTTGQSAIDQAQAYSRVLKTTTKILVLSQMDKSISHSHVDRSAIRRLCERCGFADVIDTSARDGSGIEDLRKMIARYIDWPRLAVSSPEKFARIRQEVDTLRSMGMTTIRASELLQRLQGDDERDSSSIEMVTQQLEQQGVFAKSRIEEELQLILQVEIIEQYAGSLILAARGNPRGVPALDLQLLKQPGFEFPLLERLESDEEHRSVLDCTIRLLIDKKICFKHEGLLIFPACFSTDLDTMPSGELGSSLPSWSFEGPIENIYSGIVCVLALLPEPFGQVQVWANRAEFRNSEDDYTGLWLERHQNTASGRIFLYAGPGVLKETSDLFAGLVEWHLQQLATNVSQTFSCGNCGKAFDGAAVISRQNEGQDSISCQWCSATTDLQKPVDSDPYLPGKVLTIIERAESSIQSESQDAISEIDRSLPVDVNDPIRILHLSDLHFKGNPEDTRLQMLLEDIRHQDFKKFDFLVVSGDFTDRGNPGGFDAARDFLRDLIKELNISAQNCILVPGNHDVTKRADAFPLIDPGQLRDGEWSKKLNDEYYIHRDPEAYCKRFETFANLHHQLRQVPYPLDWTSQGMSIPFLEPAFRLQFLVLNSCWEVDEFDYEHSGIRDDSVHNAIREADIQLSDARKDRLIEAGVPVLRIAVWHHAVSGDHKMKDITFLDHLQAADVRLGLHGDVHHLRHDYVPYKDPSTMIHVVATGSFGAPAEALPSGITRLYNVIEINRDFSNVSIHTRRQIVPNGRWEGLHEWPNPADSTGKTRLAYYNIALLP